MGMFQSPYDRGGVLSKEAIAERKKIYRDERSPEERKKGNRDLILLFLPLVPLTLIPGFFPKAGLSVWELIFMNPKERHFIKKTVLL